MTAEMAMLWDYVSCVDVHTYGCSELSLDPLAQGAGATAHNRWSSLGNGNGQGSGDGYHPTHIEKDSFCTIHSREFYGALVPIRLQNAHG